MEVNKKIFVIDCFEPNNKYMIPMGIEMQENMVKKKEIITFSEISNMQKKKYFLEYILENIR